MKNTALIVCLLTSTTLSPLVLADDDLNEYKLASQAITKSGITALSALERVEKEYPGVIYEYELDDEDNQQQYYHEIKLINPDTKEKLKIKVNVDTADINVWRAPLSAGYNNSEESATINAIQRSDFSIVDAVKVSALAPTQLLMEVEFEDDNNMHYYEFEILDSTGESSLLIDMKNRSVIPTYTKD